MFFSFKRTAGLDRRASRRSLRPDIELLEARLVLSFADGNGPVVTALTALPKTNQLVITFDGPLSTSSPFDPPADVANYQVARRLAIRSWSARTALSIRSFPPATATRRPRR